MKNSQTIRFTLVNVLHFGSSDAAVCCIRHVGYAFAQRGFDSLRAWLGDQLLEAHCELQLGLTGAHGSPETPLDLVYVPSHCVAMDPERCGGGGDVLPSAEVLTQRGA
jgi:hypothetical protein